MSAKCRVCRTPIFIDGQSYGQELPEGSGEWVCDKSACQELAMTVTRFAKKLTEILNRRLDSYSQGARVTLGLMIVTHTVEELIEENYLHISSTLTIKAP